MDLRSLLAAAKMAAEIGVGGVSRFIAPKAGEEQEALLATGPKLRSPGVSPDVLSSPGLNVAPKIQPKTSALGDMLKQAFSRFQPTPSATPTPTTVPTATPTPTSSPDRQRLMDMYTKGFEHWGNPPIATLAGTLADETMKYPVLQQNPELLAVLSLLESGGGRNMPGRMNSEFPGEITNENRQFNMYGWGLNPEFGFNPSSPEDVIRKVAAGIGNKPQFAPFRQSGDIQDLSRVYSPYDPQTNPHGGDVYVKNYRSIADWFQ